MSINQRYLTGMTIALALLLSLVGALAVVAQNEQPAPPTCTIQLEDLYINAMDACIGGPDGHVCNGGTPPSALPAGPVSNSLAPVGAMVPVDAIEGLTTTAITDDGMSGGFAWLRVTEKQLRIMMIGEVDVVQVPVASFPAWHNMQVITGGLRSACQTAPNNAFVVQNSNPGFEANFGLNGVSIYLDGTLLVQTEAERTVFIALEGTARIVANGQTEGMIAGQQTNVPHNPGDHSRAIGAPTIPTPFESFRLVNFPVSLLDRPMLLPQPGFVNTQGIVNMRNRPSLESEILDQTTAGEILTVLGRNADGRWYHVSTATGQTGWIFSELLVRSHGEITAVYQETPAPPQRLGATGQLARVITETGINVREDPDVTFPAIATLDMGTQVELIARSPYSPWVKVRNEDATLEGWVALIALETGAIFEALPIDYAVAPPPPPTLTPVPPGSTGNAFPDPSCWPRC